MARLSMALLIGAAVIAAMPAYAQPASCTRFREAMLRAAGDLKIEFVRPLVVSRGGGEGIEQFDLVSRARIDGSMRCRGETFVSFEATIHMPAEGALLDHYAGAQSAALMAGLGWSQGRAQTKVRAIASDAEEFLRASAERGDFSVAGKLEEHLPGGVDIAAVWTQTERTFLLLNAN